MYCARYMHYINFSAGVYSAKKLKLEAKWQMLYSVLHDVVGWMKEHVHVLCMLRALQYYLSWCL